MPRISYRGDVTVTLTVDVEALIEFGDPGGTYAISEFKITGVDGIDPAASWDAVTLAYEGVHLSLSFDDKFQDAIRAQIEDELVLEAKGG